MSNILWGGGSNFILQVLNLGFGILLGRLLTPHDYGIVGLLTIFSLIASTLQESGFVSALANKKDVQHKDYNAVFWASLFIGITLYVILFFTAPFIASFYESPELVKLSRVQFLGILIGSTGIAHAAYLFKRLKVREKAIATLLAITISGITGVVLAYSGYAYWALSVQSIVYMSTYTVLLWIFSSFKPNLHIDFEPIRTLWKFSSKVLLSNICNQINRQLFTVFLGRFYTKTDVGFFSQGNKWSEMGQSTIANMTHGFSQPILNKVTDDKDRQKRVFLKLYQFVAFMSFPALFGLAICAEEFIHITLTDKWLESVPLLQILCISSAFLPLINLLQNLILSKGKSNLYLYNILFMLGLQTAIFFVTITHGIQTIAVGVTTASIISFFVWQYYGALMSGLSSLQLSWQVFRPLTLALIGAWIAWTIGNIFTQDIWKLLIKCITLCVVYLASSFVLRAPIMLEIIQQIKERRR